MREQIATGPYFEEFIERHLLANPHNLRVTMVPDVEFEVKRRQRLQQTLEETRSTLSPEQIEELIRENEKLQQLQNQPNSPEALATIPKLPLSAIPREQEIFPLEIVDAEKGLLFSPQKTNGIAYLIFDFEIDQIPEAYIPWLPLYASVLPKLGTREFDYVELTREINIHTGGISFSPSLQQIWQEPDSQTLRLQINAKAVHLRVPKLIELITAMLEKPNFNQPQRIRESLQNRRSAMETSLKSAGHRYALSRILATQHKTGFVRELLSGIEQFLFQRRTERQFEKDPQKVSEILSHLHQWIVTRKRLRIHLTGTSAELDTLKKNLHLLDKLPAHIPAALPDLPWTSPQITANEAIAAPAKVNFVAAGINLFKQNYPVRGEGMLLARFISSEYLWNEVRVKGNAYGAGCSYHFGSGNFTCNSYRDPHLMETLQTFLAIPDFLRQFTMPQSELEKFIISTIGKLDSPRSPDEKGATAFNRYLTGVKAEDLQRLREEILDCEWGKLLENFLPAMETFAHKTNYCVVAARETLTSAPETSSRFSRILDPFEPLPE